MIYNLIALAQQAPATGDGTPLKACLIIGGIAIIVIAVTTIISKKKK